MKHDDELDAAPLDLCAERIRQAVADYVRATADGREVSVEAWAKAHPDLMPELAAELKKAKLIGAACQRAFEGGPAAVADPSTESTHGYSGAGGSALHVRCPHCHNPVDIVGDASLSDIVCSSCGSSFSLLRDTYATPTVKTLGRFELVERLGTGGFGTVWKARDTQLDRTVAVKIPREGRLATPELEQSFFREARAAAQLKHPGIVSVHEVGRQEDTIYIVSDLVRGASLSEWLSATQPSARESAELCAKIADALHHAHQAGVVHRDLKPSNIMIDMDGAPHIMDFGLARRDAGEITVTVDGQMLGTPAYMSPEQARGEAHQADRRSDVYSLGVILFQLLTGELPFRGQARMLLVQILRDEPPKPRTLKAGIPRDLQTICLKCLEKESAKRYATARELAHDLRRFLRGEPIQARPIGRVARTWRWCKRQPVSAALLAALLAGTIGTSWQAIRATLEKERANSAERQARFQAAELLFEQGWSKDELGDTSSAMLFMARSLVNLESLQRNDLNDEKASIPEASTLSQFIRAHLLQLALRSDISRALIAHDGAVIAVAFSPDGTKAATASHDKTARIWDVATGKPLGDALEHAGPVMDMAFNRDGTKLATGSLDRTARIWDVASGKPSGDALEHAGPVTKIAFSPDGTKLATGSNDHTARLWDVATGRPLGAPLQHEASVSSVAFSSNGTRLATGSYDHTARIWDVATGKPLGDTLKHVREVTAVAFSPDGTKLATGSVDTTARLWDVAKGIEIAVFEHGVGVTAVAFSPDGTKLATGSFDNTARLWDVATFKPVGDVLKHAGWVRAVAFSPDGTKLATGSTDSTARLWDVATGKQIGGALKHAAGVETLAFTRDGKKLATGSFDHTARLWDVASGNPPEDSVGLVFVSAMAFSPERTKLATAFADPTAQLWDVATGKPMGDALKHTSQIRVVVFSPDGTKLATVSSDQTARLWDVATGKQIGGALKHAAGVETVAFSRDGKKLATGSTDSTAQLWDVETATQIGGALTHSTGVKAVAFGADGTKLATVSLDQTARLWDVATGRQLRSVFENAGWVTALAFSPDDTKLATASMVEQTARIWDLATAKQIGGALEHAGGVDALAFSSDGTKLATGSTDSTARLWDVATAKQIGGALTHAAGVKAVAFSRDGTKLFTGSADCAVRVWDVTGGLVEPPQQIEHWIETLTAATVTDDGVRRQLTSEEIRRKQDALRTEGGPPRAWRAALDRPEHVVRILLDVLPYLRERGELRARAGQWKDAATDFAGAIQANPADYWLWFQSACLWLMFDDTDMYRRFCRELLNRFGQTDDPAVAERIAKACLLIADGVEDLAPVVRLVDRSVTGTENHEAYRYFLVTRGLAHYRAGEFERAVERLEKCVMPDSPEIGCDGPAYLVLAMAHHRLGHADQAAQALAKSRELLDAKTWPAINSGDLGSNWHDVVMIHILRREAEALLKESDEKSVK